jgi:hypothetical protein
MQAGSVHHVVQLTRHQGDFALLITRLTSRSMSLFAYPFRND